jgi:hypothetical protein
MIAQKAAGRIGSNFRLHSGLSGWILSEFFGALSSVEEYLVYTEMLAPKENCDETRAIIDSITSDFAAA